FGATAVLASDIPGQTRTLALAIFALYEEPGAHAQARLLVWISIGVCAVALVAYEWLGRVQKRRLAA
ncbi:MAG: molybdate ABC transporter permease subunit, partial [Myxococcota bacterium]